MHDSGWKKIEKQGRLWNARTRVERVISYKKEFILAYSYIVYVYVYICAYIFICIWNVDTRVGE